MRSKVPSFVMQTHHGRGASPGADATRLRSVARFGAQALPRWRCGFGRRECKRDHQALSLFVSCRMPVQPRIDLGPDRSRDETAPIRPSILECPLLLSSLHNGTAASPLARSSTPEMHACALCLSHGPVWISGRKAHSVKMIQRWLGCSWLAADVDDRGSVRPFISRPVCVVVGCRF